MKCPVQHLYRKSGRHVVTSREYIDNWIKEEFARKGMHIIGVDANEDNTKGIENIRPFIKRYREMTETIPGHILPLSDRYREQVVSTGEKFIVSFYDKIVKPVDYRILMTSVPYSYGMHGIAVDDIVDAIIETDDNRNKFLLYDYSRKPSDRFMVKINYRVALLHLYLSQVPESPVDEIYILSFYDNKIFKAVIGQRFHLIISALSSLVRCFSEENFYFNIGSMCSSCSDRMLCEDYEAILSP